MDVRARGLGVLRSRSALPVLAAVPAGLLVFFLGVGCAPGEADDLAARDRTGSTVERAGAHTYLEDYGAAGRAVAEETGRFGAFAREFLDWYYEAHPIRASRLGLHDADGQLPDWSPSGVERRVSSLREYLERLEGIPREGLKGNAYWDHRILEYALRAELLELEEVRSWRRDPRHYNGVVTGAVSTLTAREFAPLAERAGDLESRLRGVPALLRQARDNLSDPSDVPRIWVELALRDLQGTASFLGEDLPAALEDQGAAQLDLGLRSRLDEARTEALREVGAFSAWLESELLPRASGDFRLGRELLERKLRYEEHVDLSADELRHMNEERIAEYQAWVARAAARIDPQRPPAEIVDSIASVHPSPAELIPTARRFVEETRAFLLERDIVTLPSDQRPEVRPTPEYARMGFASMSTPGPFEDVATESYYYITNVDPEWDEERQRQHLTYFNYPGLLGITVHEAFPGHFVQLLYRPQIPTEVRKVFTPSSLVEGWAHYAEQMMVDEGLGGDDPGIRLGQLRRALQRHARWYAGLEMHAFGADVEEAAERFQAIAYFAAFPALREVQRGTYNPTYLYYALGRMQILELREAYRRQLEDQGREFSLKEFHDRFLRLGLPVSLAREVMLSG